MEEEEERRTGATQEEGRSGAERRRSLLCFDIEWQFVVKHALETCGEDLAFFNQMYDKTLLERLKDLGGWRSRSRSRSRSRGVERRRE